MGITKLYQLWLHRHSLTFKPQGYRDVLWCPYLNEPWIMEYNVKTKEVSCPNCDGNYEPSTHPFICHINKYRGGL